MTLSRRHLVLAGLLAFAATPAQAEYPERPITLIVPFAAGGGTDISARTIAQYLEKEINGRIVVVNKPGAAGEIGLAEVAGAKRDGYTLGIINTPGIVTIPIERKARFSFGSFDFIAAVVDDPGTISVLDDNPIKTVADLVAEARKRPGEVSVGTQGVGSAGHISLLLLEQVTGVRLKPIPFTGASTSRNALLAGEIQATTANLGEALTFAKGQPWRILGVMAKERSPMSPDLPTFAELGYDIEAGSLRGIGGPKGLPAEVVKKLSDGLGRVVQNDRFRETAKATFQPLRFLPTSDYVATLTEADGQFQKLWKTKPWNQ